MNVFFALATGSCLSFFPAPWQKFIACFRALGTGCFRAFPRLTPVTFFLLRVLIGSLRLLHCDWQSEFTESHEQNL